MRKTNEVKFGLMCTGCDTVIGRNFIKGKWYHLGHVCVKISTKDFTGFRFL